MLKGRSNWETTCFGKVRLKRAGCGETREEELVAAVAVAVEVEEVEVEVCHRLRATQAVVMATAEAKLFEIKSFETRWLYVEVRSQSYVGPSGTLIVSETWH